MEIQYLLDVKKTRDVRMFFLEHEGRSSQNYSILLERGRQFCKTEIVYIKVQDAVVPQTLDCRGLPARFRIGLCLFVSSVRNVVYVLRGKTLDVGKLSMLLLLNRVCKS